VYNHSETATFKEFLESHINTFEGSQIDLGFFDLNDPMDDSDKYWENLEKLIIQLYPSIVDQPSTDLPRTSGEHTATIQTLTDNRAAIDELNKRKKDMRLKKYQLQEQIIELNIEIAVIKKELFGLNREENRSLFALLKTLTVPSTVEPVKSYDDNSIIKTCEGYKIQIFGNVDNGFKGSIASSSTQEMSTLSEERLGLLTPSKESIDKEIAKLGYVADPSAKKRKVSTNTVVKQEKNTPNPHGKTRASTAILASCLKGDSVGNSQKVPIELSDGTTDSDD
jgi:hypothetical protein